MFSSEVSLLSSTYQSIAGKYPQGIFSLDQEFLEALMLRIIVYVSDNEEISIREYLDSIKEPSSWLFVSNVLAREVVRELGIGKGCVSKNPEHLPVDTKKQLCFYQHTSKSKEINFDSIIKAYSLEGKLPRNISLYNQEYLVNPTFALYSKPYLTKLMSLEGESWISTTPYAHLLSTLVEIVKHLVDDESFTEPYKLLVKARLAFTHNLILDRPVCSLVQDYLTNYRKYLQILFKGKEISANIYINLQLEYFNALLFAYKYTEAESILEQCKRVLNIDIEFTGKLGRRTKYQQFDTVQLVMNITEFKEKEKVNVEDIPEEELKIIPAQELLQLDTQYKQPSTVRLEEDSILFEKPKLNEETEQTHIDTLKQLVIVNIIYYMYETTPKDQILFLRVSSMIAPLLEEKSMDYAVKLALLALRSLNQLPRYKNSDRALEQLQQLVNQYHEPKGHDHSNVLATPSGYRIHLTFLKLVGEKVMGFGLVMTGVEMYQKAGLYEQCVEGLLAGGHKTKAIELATKLLGEQGADPSPYLLCLMGDGTGDTQYYERAWKQSKNTYPRAQRTLGRIYFMKKDYEASIQAYKKALAVSFYNPSDWFTLGCAYLSLNQFSDGAKAFSQTISIDDSQGDGWGNLASCFLGQKKYNQAYGALAQALKFSQSSWKLWQNMMGVSLKLKKFYKFMQCINRLIAINANKLVTEEILEKLNQILDYRTTLLETERKRVTYTYKNRMEQEYSNIREKMGEKGYVWRQYANYLTITIGYLKELERIYLGLHAKGEVDPNDIIPGFEDPATIPALTAQAILQTQNQIVQAKQKQLNMTMQLGWQSNKEKREEVKRVLKEYKEKYLEVHQEDEDFSTFVNSILVNIKVAESK